MNGVLVGEGKGGKGKTEAVALRRAFDGKIQRHTPIQGAANPFDPAWETYFEKRLDVKTEPNLTRKRQLLHLWKEQDGPCPMCHQKTTCTTGGPDHHRPRRRQR